MDPISGNSSSSNEAPKYKVGDKIELYKNNFIQFFDEDKDGALEMHYIGAKGEDYGQVHTIDFNKFGEKEKIKYSDGSKEVIREENSNFEINIKDKKYARTAKGFYTETLEGKKNQAMPEQFKEFVEYLKSDEGKKQSFELDAQDDRHKGNALNVGTKGRWYEMKNNSHGEIGLFVNGNPDDAGSVHISTTGKVIKGEHVQEYNKETKQYEPPKFEPKS